MIQVRQRIFETNSSSTHSICISFKKLNTADSKLSIIGDICYLDAVDQMDDFYDSSCKVRGERDKLDYIFTWMYLREHGLVKYGEPNNPVYWPEPCDINTGNYENQYQNLLNAVKRRYPEIKKFCFENPKYAEFDHQTGPNEEDPIVNLDDVDDIYEYLFNDHIYIQIGHD